MFQILLSLDNAGVVVISLDVASVEVEVASVTLVVPVVIPRASFSCSRNAIFFLQVVTLLAFISYHSLYRFRQSGAHFMPQ